jgi:hypothetical protein
MDPKAVRDQLFLGMSNGVRPRRRLAPALRPLESRQLLSGGLTPSATMTQTATFPNLESLPNVANQALLYFSSTMGTLTEVDLVTSGSFSTQFYAENLGSSSTAIDGTTSGNLSINVPTGAIPVTIPSVTETFNAAPFEGNVDYSGTSGKDFAPVTSSSATKTTVLTSPADLAAFTGNFRIPISVSGHATGNASSGNGDLSDGFNTQTSATLTIIYHYIPNLPSTNPPPADTSPTVPSSGNGTGSSASPASSSNTSQSGAGNLGTTATIHAKQSTVVAKKKAPVRTVISTHRVTPHPVVSHIRPKPVVKTVAVKSRPTHVL